MKVMRLLAALLAASGAAVLLAACGSQAGRAGSSSRLPASPTPAASPSPRPTPAQLPGRLAWTRLADLSAGSGYSMGGPAVLTSTGIWIATEQKNQLIQFTAQGGATPMNLPAQPAGSFPQGIAAASDGSIWISESGSVIQVGPDKEMTTYAVAGRPNGRITQGPDGAVWVTELGLDKIARIAGGQVKEFPLPAPPIEVQCGGRCPYGITSGPDENLWITESQLSSGDRVGRMSMQGAYTSWALPESGAILSDIAQGPDGALWFGENHARRLGSITTTGVINEQVVDLPAHASGTALVSSSGGLIWYTPSLPPPYSDDPAAVGAALPGGASRYFEIPSASSFPTAVLPVPGARSVVIDVVTYSGQIWQGTGP